MGECSRPAAAREPLAISRRGLLGGLSLAAAATLAGCGSGRTASAAHPSPSGTAGATAGPAAEAGRPPLPEPLAWRARTGEVNPQVKARAAQLLQLAGTWSDGGGGAAATARRLAAAGHDETLLPHLGFLAPIGEPDAAVTNVTDAQYGGILTDSASVLVALVQWYRGPDGSVQRHGSTFDVRLRHADPQWVVTEVRPADPGPAVDRLSDPARVVLANSRIRLPDSARADVMAGQIHDSVLTALDTLARRQVLDVSVLRSGHPLLVFGTSRPSDHPYGRAADIWAIDGALVVDPVNRDLVATFMRAAAQTGPWQVGGPVDLDGSAHQYFSDDTHHDHVHMGFRA